MKIVKADFNRRGPRGTLKVSLRRFNDTPIVGEQFIAVDGEDMFIGSVKSVDPTGRTVLMDMSWGQILRDFLSSSSARDIRGTFNVEKNTFVNHVSRSTSPEPLGNRAARFGSGELLEA